MYLKTTKQPTNLNGFSRIFLKFFLQNMKNQSIVFTFVRFPISTESILRDVNQWWRERTRQAFVCHSSYSVFITTGFSDVSEEGKKSVILLGNCIGLSRTLLKLNASKYCACVEFVYISLLIFIVLTV